MSTTYTSDRTLLELAARSIGFYELDFDYPAREGMPFLGPRLPLPQGIVMGTMYTYWNPLTNDGDALRLACDLGLHVYTVSRTANGWSCSAVADVTGELLSEVTLLDVRSATRRAIVLAAAKISV